MRIPNGKVDQTIYFVALDATDHVTRETGLSSFTVYRSRNGAAEVAYTTPTVTEIDAINMPGVYALLIDEDTTVASASDSEEYCVHITEAAMAPVTRTVELYRRDTTSGRTVEVDADNYVAADARKLSASATAADNLELGARALVPSTCAVGSTTTSIVTNLAEATDDHYNGRVITFVTGALAGQSTNITDYNGTTKTLTVTALSEAPANTDIFVIS